MFSEHLLCVRSSALGTGISGEQARRSFCPHRAPAGWHGHGVSDFKCSELRAGEALCSQGDGHQGPGMVHRFHKSYSEEIQINKLRGN